MAYRAQPRRLRPRVTARSNGHGRRVALLRLRSKPKPKSNAGLLGIIALFVGLLLVGGVTAGVATAGGAAVVTLELLSQDLPDVSTFEELEFAQPSIVYDRSGTVELARFQSERRRVVRYDEIPQLVLDATTAVEDRTFWENEGYDPNAIVSVAFEALTTGRERGASTITQQFVRARLLPEDVLRGDLYTRKAKEIIQANRLTQAFPGEEGKQRIITAYLNQIYYGHNAYGIAAAAQVYFDVDELADLTPAQAAVLAGLAQAPNTYDLFKWAERDQSGRLVVPISAAEGERLPVPVERRNYILRNLAAGHGRWTVLSEIELDRALREPIVLAEEDPQLWRAPHFVWHMKQQLDAMLADRAPAERGGYRIITSLDWDAQQVAERYITAATIYPFLPREEFDRVIEAEGLEEDREWISFLRGKDIHNGALVALDARSGDVLAYVGSAGYYRNDLASQKLNPKYDVVGQGYRQPGSAWKPMVYVAGFETGKLTPGTLLLDVTTQFGEDRGQPWVPRNADLGDRGPVLARQGMYYSLNVSTIRAMNRVGVDPVAELSERLGLTFPRGPRQILQAGLAGAIGTVEVNMLEYASAFGSFGTGGMQFAPRSILEIRDSGGELIFHAGAPAGEQVVSPQSAYLMTDILKGNTDPEANPQFGPLLQVRNGPDGARRPATIKTGTTNELRSLSAYGYLAPPPNDDEPQVMVGVWMGNSDNSPPDSGDQPAFASSGPGRVWKAFMRDYSRDFALADFAPPEEGLVQVEIDAWSGGTPGPWTRETVSEWFIAGTEPGAEGEIDPAGLLYRQMCDTWYVDPRQVEPDAPGPWQEAVEDWVRRARIGEGQRSEWGTSTRYLRTRSSWGGPIVPTVCATPPPPPTPGPTRPPGPGPTPAPQPTPEPEPEPEPTPDPGPPDRTPKPPKPPGDDNGGGSPGPPEP